MAARTDLRFDVAALDRASQVFTRLGRAVESFERRLERLDKERVSVDVEVGTEKAERQVGAFATDMQRRLTRAIAALPDIELDADASDAQRDIARIRAALVDLSGQRIGVDIDAADAEARMRLLQAELEGLREHADVQVRVDAEQAARAIGLIRDEIGETEREVGQFARNLSRDIRRAVESLPDIELDADAGPVEREVQRIRGELAALADQRIGIDLDATEAHARAQALERELRLLGDLKLDVQLEADVATALTQLRAVRGEVDALDGRTANVRIDVDRSLSEKIVQVAAFGRALGTLAVPASLAASIPTVLQLGAAVVTATGALGVVPAAGTAALAAVAALTIGLQGLGDALDEDPKKAGEALAKLAPAARDTVNAIRGFGPAWREAQLDVQQRLFDGLATRVQALGRTYLPIVRGELGNVATSFSTVGERVADMLNRAGRVADLRVIFGQAAAAVDDVLQAVEPLAGALVDVAAVGSGVFRDMTGGAREAAVEFAAFIATARQSGQLAGWMRDGVEQVRQFGRIAVDAGATVLNVLNAAEDAGGGFLDILERITSATRDWTASAEGQATIVAVFRSIREAVDAAAPGVERLVSAVASVIQRLGDAGVLRAAGEAFSAIASEAAPLVEQLGNLAPAVTAVLNVARDLAPVLVPAAAAVAGFWAATKVVGGISSVTTAVGGFVGRIRDLGSAMSASGGVTGGIRALASSLGAGGILGIALAAAGVALSVYASAQADAAQAAAEHKARVDELRGTLDQYTGAATAATKAQVAQELGSRKLADGTTSYATALQQAGVSLADYTDAASGNEEALGRVRGQLDRHVAKLIEASPAYQNNSREIAAMGISLEDLAAAAQGNGPAMDRLNDAVTRSSAGSLEAQGANQLLLDSLLGAGRGAGELGDNLNRMAGQLAEAQQQQRDAATAARDFGATLDSIKAGFAGLADGAQQTELMRAGLLDLATAAREGATASGEQAAKLGGVAAGAKAAADSMQQSRDAFIAAATSAGLTQQQAEALANALGLIPSVARTQFETNATETATQILGVQASLAAVPGAKDVRVQALTDEARTALDQMGLRVEQLPDGTFQVFADTAAARANLDAFTAGAANTTAEIKVGAQTLPAQEAFTAILSAINSGAGTVTINGQSMPAQAALSFALGLINGGSGTVTINGQDVPARAALSAYLAAVNSGSGTATINGRDVPARQVLGAFVQAANSASGTATVRANTGPAVAALNSLVTSWNGRTIYVNIGGNRVTAGGGVFGYAGGGTVPNFRTARRSTGQGLVIPGYAPGKDDVPIIASRGESVLVPELTRALGARRILAWNAQASGGRAATVAGNIAGIMNGTIPATAAGGFVPTTRDDLRAGLRGRVRSAIESFRQAPTTTLGSPAELRAMLGQLRALRGDVDMSGWLSALVGELQGLRRDLATVRGPSYAESARDAGVLGGTAWH